MSRRGPDPAAPSALRVVGEGAADIVSSLRRPSLWVVPGWYDFILAYRRTAIGPFWETVAAAAWVGGIGLVFGRILGAGDANYPAYAGAGVVLWLHMSSVAAGSANLFTSKRIFILNVAGPVYAYVLRYVVVGLARLAMRAPALAAALAVAAWAPGPERAGPPDLPMAVLGFAAIVLASLWAAPLIGFLCARRRDAGYALDIAMRFLFFATPVFWRADDLGDRALLARANPFAHFLEVARAPLIGEPAWSESWTVVAAVNLAGLAALLLLHGHCARRTAFWV